MKMKLRGEKDEINRKNLITWFFFNPSLKLNHESCCLDMIRLIWLVQRQPKKLLKKNKIKIDRKIIKLKKN
jgi:hypothetical protein